MLAKGQPVSVAGADDEPFSILADDGTIKPGTPRSRNHRRGCAQALPRHAAGAPRRRPHDEAAAPGPPRLLHAVDRRRGDPLRRRLRAARRATGSSRPTASPASSFWRGYTHPATSSTSCSATPRIRSRAARCRCTTRRKLAQLRLDLLAGRHADPAGGRAWPGPRKHHQEGRRARWSTSARARPRRASSTSGMNFAGVFKAPCIFFCRNNGWAISTPSEQADRGQDRSPSRRSPTACRASASTATICSRSSRSMQDAVERARAGEGPTLIEAVTYRRGGHSSSDDPSVVPRSGGAEAVGGATIRSSAGAATSSTRGLWSAGARTTSTRKEITDELMAALKHAERARPPAGRDDVRRRLRRAAAAPARAAGGADGAAARQDRATEDTDNAGHEHHPGGQRRAAHRDAARPARRRARRGRRQVRRRLPRHHRASSTSSAPIA